MDTIVFGSYTLEQLLYAAGGIVVVIVVLMFVKKLFAKKEDRTEHIQVVHCKSCGWKGQVSRYVGKCPKCSGPLGDQKAQPKKRQ